MRSIDVNLARRPFVNQRPVTRLAWLLWGLGLVLLAVNVINYRAYFSGSDERQEELAALEEQIGQHRSEIDRLEESLRSMSLAQQNDQVEFLNRKIAERTFSWSHLFDQLEEVLPADVRLSSLTPAIAELAERRTPGAEEDAGERIGDRVRMRIVAVAKSVDAQLEFVDNLFAHPSFEKPRLSSDTQDSGASRFNLAVNYLPVRPRLPDGSLGYDEDGMQVAATGAGTEPEGASGGAVGDPSARGGADPFGRRAGSGEAAGGTSGRPRTAPGGRGPQTARGGISGGASGSPVAGQETQTPGPGEGPRDRRAGSPTVIAGGAAAAGGVPSAGSGGEAGGGTVGRGGSTGRRPAGTGGPGRRSGGPPPETNPPPEGGSPDPSTPTGRTPSASAALEPQ